jgi:UDP-glucose 4-epimerase
VRDYIHVQDSPTATSPPLVNLARAQGAFTLNLGLGRGLLGARSRRRVRARLRPQDHQVVRAAPARRRCMLVRGSLARNRGLNWHPTRDLDAICAERVAVGQKNRRPVIESGGRVATARQSLIAFR